MGASAAESLEVAVTRARSRCWGRGRCGGRGRGRLRALDARGAVLKLGKVLPGNGECLVRRGSREEFVVKPLHRRVGHLVAEAPPADAKELRVVGLAHAEKTVGLLGGRRVQEDVKGGLHVLRHSRVVGEACGDHHQS